MIEDPKEALLKFLNQEAEKTTIERTKREAIRQQLEESARNSLQLYEQSLEELRPKAEEKLETVIQPWWNEIKETGVYGQILDSIDFKTWAQVHVSKFFTYWWPHRSIEVTLSSSKPFDESARRIIDSQDYEVRLSKTIDYMSKESWRARFFICKPGSRYGYFNLKREPNDIRDGRFVALHRIEEPVSLEDPKLLISQVPAVIVDFAEQIETGSVWATIERSVKGLENW